MGTSHKNNCELDDLRAGFEIAEGHRLGHFAEVNFQDAIGEVGYSDSASLSIDIFGFKVSPKMK